MIAIRRPAVRHLALVGAGQARGVGPLAQQDQHREDRQAMLMIKGHLPEPERPDEVGLVARLELEIQQERTGCPDPDDLVRRGRERGDPRFDDIHRPRPVDPKSRIPARRVLPDQFLGRDVVRIEVHRDLRPPSSDPLPAWRRPEFDRRPAMLLRPSRHGRVACDSRRNLRMISSLYARKDGCGMVRSSRRTFPSGEIRT